LLPVLLPRSRSPTDSGPLRMREGSRRRTRSWGTPCHEPSSGWDAVPEASRAKGGWETGESAEPLLLFAEG
jgi:hypothetical protein